MKSIQQILEKVNKLKRQLTGKTICENFGDRAQLLLSQYQDNETV